MTARHIGFTGRVAASLRAVGELVKDVFVSAEASDFCCGVRFERTRPASDMPTPGSCCGARF